MKNAELVASFIEICVLTTFSSLMILSHWYYNHLYFCSSSLCSLGSVQSLKLYNIFQVGDFGLARWQPEGDKGVETRVIGTFGYCYAIIIEIFFFLIANSSS